MYYKKKSIIEKKILGKTKDGYRERTIDVMERCGRLHQRENQTNIKYSRTPIIDINKQTRTYRTSRGKKQVKATIHEYTDWNHGETFKENPINIYRDPRRIVQIRNYINTVRRRRRRSGKKRKGREGEPVETLREGRIIHR